ncbi:MAG: twitching motility response regulator PilH [Gammaproteobacteria bacterium]|nr:twitching motility response regulator PilH [Gammaproteobacteria bacterium]
MKILVVDDSPTETYVVKTYLEKHHYEVLVANTGEDGVRLAQTELPDAILMDVVMPGMNGFQATRQLTKDARTANIPIIMLTTKGGATDKVWGMRQGALDYLVKPVEEDDLIGRLGSLLGSV